MPRLLFAGLAVAAVRAAEPGGYTSISESALKHGVKALVPKVVDGLKSLVLPGINQSLFSIEPIRFQDVSIGSYDVAVLAGQGVEVQLKDMSNTIAHTKLTVDLKLIKCTGEIWASATGASYTAMNTIVVDGQGNGQLQTVTPPGGFDAGSIEVHHQMDGFMCEAAADVLHLVDGVLIDVVKQALQSYFAGMVAKIVDLPANLLLKEVEQPLPLGFGKEKFQLDNSFLSVSYDGQRISHFHKSEFKSTLHPVESPLQPPQLALSGQRDVEFAFSDYVVNTLFDAMYAEHIGEAQINIPFVKTIFDKECPKCPIVLQSTFSSPSRQSFAQGSAVATVFGLSLAIGALNNASQVLPMVTLSINASAGVAFSLQETATNYAVKVTLALQDLQQSLVISHIGPIDMSDLTRDVKLLITTLLDTLNKDIPALPLPAIGGVKLDQPAIRIAERSLVVEADFVPSETESALLII